jgi:ubiquinone/menaquinone biosynthesis C-methylase UbiE
MRSFESDMPMIEVFVDLKGKDMLEIGCGGGRISSLLAAKVKSLAAIDPDEGQIALARKSVDGVDFRVGTGENLEFRDASFDIVMFSYSLHHQDCIKALGEGKRVLRQNGDLLIIEPAHDGEYTRFVSIFEEDEISRIKNTLARINSEALEIIRHDAYFVNYQFTDEEELYNHFSTCFGDKNSEGCIEEMKSLLENASPTRPIIVRDKVNIFLLT